MNQLNKLIEQYETENPDRKAGSFNIGVFFGTPDFILWLASRPTCGKEQRKFLDEIEKYGPSALYNTAKTLHDNHISMQKVIKGE